ncbi:MAG: helix-turn-helix transcriptional regulator, partial [Brevundimonas sp.]|nr:helix-turn-helix transcriptional regulator [Brevundimonas sp.]
QWEHNIAHIEQYEVLCQVITAEQIRAARASIGWSAEELSKAAGIARRTVVSIESSSGIPAAHTQTLAKIQTALEAAGIEFIGTPDDAPGIRIHAPKA